MFDEITDLESIHKQKREISEREEKLSTPKLNDLKLIPTIYVWFCEFHDSGHYKNNVVQLRKQFVFIILYLYSPRKLACQWECGWHLAVALNMFRLKRLRQKRNIVIAGYMIPSMCMIVFLCS